MNTSCHITKLFVVKVVTWSNNYLLRFVISYLKPSNYMQTNDYYDIEMIIWNHIIISIKKEYLKS